MKKLIYLILFLPVIGFGQTYPYQIEPDTTHRMIMMTDTSVIDSPALEFVYSSIDSLVEQIARDTLGLDSSLWKVLNNEISYYQKSDSLNIFLGVSSGNNSLTGTQNIFVGSESGFDLTTGNNNVGLGYRSLYNTTTGYNNISIGTQTFNSMLSIHSSIAIGYRAGFSTTSGAYSTYIGREAGFSSNGNGQTYIGYRSGYDLEGNYNVGIGYWSLYGQSGASGSYNNGFGYLAGRFITTGGSNTFIGRESGYNTTTGSYNNFIGYKAGYSNLGASDNVFIGKQSGENNISGTSNFAGGTSSLNSNLVGNYNMALGYEAGFSALGSRNVFIGYRSGYSETGSDKLYISNSSSTTPLIYGDFANDTLRINGNLEVRDKTGTAGNLAGFDGDQIVDSGIDASSVLTSEVDGSVTNELQTLSFSNPNLSISSGNTVSLSSINYWDYNGTTSEIYTTTNVGINTTNPSYDLDVIGNMRLSGIFYDGVSSSGSSGNIIENSSGEMRWVSKSSIGLSEFNNDLGLTSTPWTIAASDEIYFNTAGNDIVGINTISPTRNLQVNGTGYFSQDLEIVQDLKAVSATTSFEDTDGDRGASGDLLGRDANGLDWVSPSNISENDLDNDMPTGKAIKGTNTTISVSGTVLSLTSLDINSPSGWSIGTSTNLEVPETGLYLVVVNFAKENSNCTSMTAVLRSDATTLYTWYPADYSNQIGFSASTIESLTSTSSLNVIVTSSTSGCNVFNYEISATKLSD